MITDLVAALRCEGIVIYMKFELTLFDVKRPAFYSVSARGTDNEIGLRSY
jgi:hypothetical protein